jgi:hypothetical protein
MTQPSAKADASNERFRDLADVLLLRDLVEDLAAVRAACVEVFAFRGTHEWPPALEPMAFWEDLYAELAAGLELAEKTLEEASHTPGGHVVGKQEDRRASLRNPTVFMGLGRLEPEAARAAGDD